MKKPLTEAEEILLDAVAQGVTADFTPKGGEVRNREDIKAWIRGVPLMNEADAIATMKDLLLRLDALETIQ